MKTEECSRTRETKISEVKKGGVYVQEFEGQILTLTKYQQNQNLILIGNLALSPRFRG